jgi:hypothetical protein
MNRKIKTATGNININLPDKLQQVSLSQLMAMQSAKQLSDLEAISILSNTPLHDLQNITDVNDLQVFNAQVLSIAHQIKYLYNSDAIPQKTTFIIEGKQVSVKVMKNLSVEPAGAFMAAREVIADEIAKHIQQHGEADWQERYNPSLQSCAQVLAQYFYCRATGKPYNEYAAAEFEEQVKQLPVTDALPIAKYFFFELSKLIETENFNMKYILIILMAFIVSATAQAQVKPTVTDSVATYQLKAKGKLPMPTIDTVYTIRLNKTQFGVLQSVLETTYNLLPRSADLTALQASEGQKQIVALSKFLADQLPISPSDDAKSLPIKK